MSKKQRILDLYDGVRTTREIAEIVSCLPEYVRVVARQRATPAGLEARRAWDRRYFKLRYADPAFRAMIAARNARYQQRVKSKQTAEAHP